MIFSVIPGEKFKKEAKRLINKFPSLKQELTVLGNEFSQHPTKILKYFLHFQKNIVTTKQ